MKLADIADRYGVSHQAVGAAIRRNYIGTRCRRCQRPVRHRDNLELLVCERCEPILNVVEDISLTCKEAGRKACVSGSYIASERRKLGLRPAYRSKQFRNEIPADALDPQIPPTQVERKYGLTRNTITHLRKKLHVPKILRPNWNPGRRWTATDDEILLSMREDGYTFIEIGRKLRRSGHQCQSRLQNVKSGRSKPSEGSPLAGLYCSAGTAITALTPAPSTQPTGTKVGEK